MPLYSPCSERYTKIGYRYCGNSGLQFPLISLGLWQNFGDQNPLSEQTKILTTAFDTGITHFDLANNYGPPADAAEINFGTIFKENFKSHRHELLISTKAGYYGWQGPYGDGGSRKYLLSSIERSLRHLQIDYVDLFYHHRPDPKTPLEETMKALDQIVRQGKALYIGLSNYTGAQTLEATTILKSLGTPCLIHQPIYNMFNRTLETDLLPVLRKTQIGCIPFCPLAQGLLTNRYLQGIPENSRIGRGSIFLKQEQITPKLLLTIQKLNDLAKQRDQTVAQMALSWILRLPEITSLLIGASSVEQLIENSKSLNNLQFSEVELNTIEKILTDNR